MTPFRLSLIMVLQNQRSIFYYLVNGFFISIPFWKRELTLDKEIHIIVIK